MNDSLFDARLTNVPPAWSVTVLVKPEPGAPPANAITPWVSFSLELFAAVQVEPKHCEAIANLGT